MSEIQNDERVLFFPTYGRRAEGEKADGQAAWLLDIHGIVFQPEFTSRKRDLIARIARSLLPRNDNTIELTMFRRRFWSFLVDNIGGRIVQIRLGGQTYKMGPSTPDGHFRGTIRVPSEPIQSLLEAEEMAPPWITFEAVVPATCPRRYRGRVTPIEPTGLSVISDIDDTIKISDVADTSRLIANVLARRYESVPGMAEVYRDWARQGATFHLVSASPWQLYRPLARFCRQAGFPPATYHLKKWRLKEPSTLDLFQSSAKLKIDAIENILRDFPQRRFILVGDSTQNDPEAYGQLIRDDDAQQIVAALIRNVTGAEMTQPRLRDAFANVDERRWRLFDDASELQDTF